MRWVTQRGPTIDRLASAWLIQRFVDPSAIFLFVAAEDIALAAASAGAVPFDAPPGTPEAELIRPRGGCCFDAIRARFKLDDPALDRVADIVRAAENEDHVAPIPEASGLRAISLGLARIMPNDDERIAFGMILYDALHHWARGLP